MAAKMAKAVAAVVVNAAHKVDGEVWIETDCADYDAFAALPGAVEFEGRICGKSGWNSDTGRAYYGSARATAKAVA